VSPLWDCFTNNAGSMALARSCGFRPIGPAYSFYTISK
jgi:RimJ/RimL family protein N-acetyltransferase